MCARARIVKGKHARAVVLASGGLDSAVTAAIALRECDAVTFLHASYGQRTWRKERACARKLARHFGVEIVEIRLSHLAAFGGSCLTDETIPVPQNALHQGGIPASYVPFRNANLLAAAVSLAERCGAGAVYIGAVEEDGSGYPDCRKSFFRAFARAAELGTRPETHVAIETPVVRLPKSEIVRLGARLDVPFQFTWSCYKDEDRPCNQCDSCILRAGAFERAGVRDPI